MARPLRINFENAVYYIITRGNRKEKIFYCQLKDKTGLFLNDLKDKSGLTKNSK
jgi:REP element-mobilizing transposase RayT